MNWGVNDENQRREYRTRESYWYPILWCVRPIEWRLYGLIHISELSDGYVKDIRDFVNIGQYIDVKVLKFNSDNHQARLSLKGVANNNYRYHRMKASDFETSSGFAPLAQHLPIWIRDSLEKIARVNKED